jgi:NinB protein
VIEPKRRSLQANARMWAMLSDISRQVVWHGQKLCKDDWKTMATAALKRQRVVPGIEGGFVVLGEHTSTMTIAQMNELMKFLEAFGAQHGVRFTARFELEHA